MNITLIIGVFLIILLAYKAYDCAFKKNLNTIIRIKFLISLSLLLSYIGTGYFLDYPDSLYWFIFIAVLIISLSLSSTLVRNEFKRYLSLNYKDKIINTSYYALIILGVFIIF